MASPPTPLGFVCIQNAGRSQMATAFAEHERTTRRLGEQVEIRTGGTDPQTGSIGLSSKPCRKSESPSRAAGRDEELVGCDIVAMMGCSTLDLDPAAGVAVRDWALDDAAGKTIWRVREIRDQVERLVVELFDEVESAHRQRATTN